MRKHEHLFYKELWELEIFPQIRKRWNGNTVRVVNCLTMGGGLASLIYEVTRAGLERNNGWMLKEGAFGSGQRNNQKLSRLWCLQRQHGSFLSLEKIKPKLDSCWADTAGGSSNVEPGQVYELDKLDDPQTFQPQDFCDVLIPQQIHSISQMSFIELIHRKEATNIQRSYKQNMPERNRHQEFHWWCQHTHITYSIQGQHTWLQSQ